MFHMKYRIITRRVLLGIIMISLVVFLVSHYDSQEYSVENEQEYIVKLCEMSDVPGMSVAIMDEDAESYLDYSKNEDVIINNKTLFELASTTKAFTALGILQLEKEEKIDLTDSVDEYISWFKPVYNGKTAIITIEELLCHTSGIPAWTISLIPVGTCEDSDIYQTIHKIDNIKLNNEPGTVHEYATINYDVLALIIEEVTGQKYENYITENILDQLGMNDSFFRVEDCPNKITQGYKVSYLRARPFDAPTYYGNTAAGYLVTNTSDLMKWMKNVNSLFDFESFEATDTNNYYAGWNIYDDYLCHAGNNPNYSSQIIISRNDELGVFVLSDLSGSSATTVADGIYRMHLGEKIKIGLYIDDNSLVDYLSLISILFMIYLLLLIQINSTVKAILNQIMGWALITGIILFPVLAHYDYRFIKIWCPNSVLLFLLGAIVFASIQIIRSMMWIKRKKWKKYGL